MTQLRGGEALRTFGPLAPPKRPPRALKCQIRALILAVPLVCSVRQPDICRLGIVAVNLRCSAIQLFVVAQYKNRSKDIPNIPHKSPVPQMRSTAVGACESETVPCGCMWVLQWRNAGAVVATLASRAQRENVGGGDKEVEESRRGHLPSESVAIVTNLVIEVQHHDHDQQDLL